MKVFITGATGYIGNSVAQAFRRAGHKVYGLTRNAEKGKLLIKNEIVPVIGSMQNPSSYNKIASECDVIVHAAADYHNNLSEIDKNTVKELINTVKKTGEIKKLIYTSGTWIYGSNNNVIINETSTPNPIKIVKWRPEIDDIVISNPFINGVVIRPGCVYGKQGDMTNDWFDSMKNMNELNIVGDGTNRWPMVHIDDLADAYLQSAEKNIGGEIFNIVEEESSSINQIISEIKTLTNFNGNVNYIPISKATGIMGDFAEALAIDQKFDISKPKKILNWEPKHSGFHNEINLYYSNWEAFQQK
jgi:nucleoside-diphosphate-sugar epimerase